MVYGHFMLLLKKSFIYVVTINVPQMYKKFWQTKLRKIKNVSSHFSSDTKDNMVEFEERIMKDLLKFYESPMTHLFLSPFDDANKVNVIVFQSHLIEIARSWIVNLSNEKYPFKETLCFAGNLRGLHIDPVIPCKKLQRISNVKHFLTYFCQSWFSFLLQKTRIFRNAILRLIKRN